MLVPFSRIARLRREHRGNSRLLACGREVGEMYNSYTLYQAEQVRTAREQREQDIRAGELSADLGRLWHSLAPHRASGQRRSRKAAHSASSAQSCQAVRHRS